MRAIKGLFLMLTRVDAVRYVTVPISSLQLDYEMREYRAAIMRDLLKPVGDCLKDGFELYHACESNENGRSCLRVRMVKRCSALEAFIKKWEVT